MTTNGSGGRINWGAKRKVKSLPLEEIGETIKIRALSAEQLDTLKPEDDQKTVRLLALSIVNDDLKRLYVTEEEVAELGEMSITLRKLISDEISLLNGFSPEAIADAEKKSEASLNTASVTD